MTDRWFPEGAEVVTGCPDRGCLVVGWRFPTGRECCFCGEYMDAHGNSIDVGHQPRSMGPQPTFLGSVEGWCPDHGFWFYNDDGMISFSWVVENPPAFTPPPRDHDVG